MSLLLICNIYPQLSAPEFGGDFSSHIARKAHPKILAASRTAWSLLAYGLKTWGIESLPDVTFGPQGKPSFPAGYPQFSLAHSGSLAAVLISVHPCGVDVEQVRSDVTARLYERCLCPQERAQKLDFFECWTKKECIGKRDGRGIGAHPACLNTLDGSWERRFFCVRVKSLGEEYVLSALCEDADQLKYVKILPEALL